MGLRRLSANARFGRGGLPIESDCCADETCVDCGLLFGHLAMYKSKVSSLVAHAQSLRLGVLDA
eukprot:11982872-Alexandrium_andersonii.AAC.1